MDKPNPDNRGEFFDQFLDDYYAECDEHLVCDTPLAGDPRRRSRRADR